MKVLVIDGQGGGMGRELVEALKRALPDQPICAVGTNAMATAAMLKAGADAGATGENAVLVNCRDAGLILGPLGIVLADALMGEISPAMAAAVGASPAVKLLLPASRCNVCVAGTRALTLRQAVDAAVEQAREFLLKDNIC